MAGAESEREPVSEPELAAGQAPIDSSRYQIDAREVEGLQIGEHNVQVNYFYQGTWTSGATPRPLVELSGAIASPYRGLSAFGERDAALFFGRDTAIAQVMDRMSRCLSGLGLLVISGVSGAGKSSLIQAGVLPLLRGSGLAAAPEAMTWPCVVLTAGSHPLRELAARVAPVTGADAAAVLGSLSADPAGFAATARQAALAGPGTGPPQSGDAAGRRRLILVVDQCEQLFTWCQDEDERQKFVTALHAAASEDQGPDQLPAALVVLVVRADFEARLAAGERLHQAVQDRYLLTSMTARQLEVAITEPARVAGSGVDPHLVRVLKEEVHAGGGLAADELGGAVGAGVLPLLSHALDQAWRARSGEMLTLADYERVGGIAGAVAESAESGYGRLSPRQQTVARQVFIRLTATSSDGVDTAARASLADLKAGRDEAGQGDVERVLQTFADERLLTLDADGAEISHEALLTAWPLLRDEWLAETHADRLVRSRLQGTATEWLHASRDSSYLYSGIRLEEANSTAARITLDNRHAPIGAAERDFLAASNRASINRARRRRAVTAVLAALVVGFASVAFYAITSARSVAHQRDVAVSSQLASNSETMGPINPTLSALLAVAAWRIDPSDAAMAAMQDAAARSGVAAIPIPSTIAALAFSPDREILAIARYEGNVQFWNAVTGKQIGAPINMNAGHGGFVTDLAFSHDGSMLATGSTNDKIQLWRVVTRKPITSPLTVSGDTTTGISAISFSTDDRLLAAANYNGVTRLWNTVSHRPFGTVFQPGSDSLTSSIAFSPDDKVLAVNNGDNGDVQMWNLATHKRLGTPIRVPAGGDVLSEVEAMAFSPNGSMLATAGGDNSVRFWSVSSHRQVGRPLTGDTDTIHALAFSPDGSLVVSSSDDGTVRLWSVSSRQQLGEPLVIGAKRAYYLAFDPSGTTVAIGGESTVRLSSLHSRASVATLSGDASPVESLAFSPDGKTLAAGGFGTLQLWNVTDRRRASSLASRLKVPFDALEFSSDSRTLVFAQINGLFWFWNPETKRITGPINSDPSRSGAVSFSPDGKTDSLAFGPHDATLAVSNLTGGVSLWKVATRRQIGATFQRGDDVSALAYSRDGKILATGSTHGVVRLWSAATHQQIGQLRDSSGAGVIALAFSPDGDRLAIGSQGDSVQIWSTVRNRQIGGLLTGDVPVSSMALSPDGRTLAVGYSDGTARLWSVATQQPIGSPLPGQSGPVTGIAFSPDGQTLATAGSSRAVRLWNLSYISDVVSRLCAQARRSLTRTEWAHYVPEAPYRAVC